MLPLTLLLAPLTFGADIIIFGDSWASEGAAPFAAMLKAKGSNLTSYGVGVSGTTAAHWAENPNSMKDAVAAHGGDAVKYVWLTICGNDAKDTLPLCFEGKEKCIAKVVAKCTEDAATFVKPALAAYPNLRVVQFGYDILGFGKNVVCEALAVALIPGCAGNTTCFNIEFTKLQANYVDKFASALGPVLGARFDAVNVLGTLQASEHVGAARIGDPDLAKFSPNDLMQSNCIHPTVEKGFGIVFDALYDIYFKNRTAATLEVAKKERATPFVHPGVLVSNRQLEAIRHQVLVQRHGPMFEAYKKALNSTFARKTFAPHGPPECGIIVCGSYSKPNIGCGNESSDVATAYLQALLWAINGNPTFAANAIAALNAYASHLRGYGGVKACVADSLYNAPLQAAWSGMMYSKAAELLAHAKGGGPQGESSGWASADQQRLKAMLTNVTVPLIYAGSAANGNWELSMLDALIGIAVFTDNRTMFNHAVAFWRQRVPAYFWIDSDGPYPIHCPRDHSQWNSSGFGSGTFYGQVVLNTSTVGVCQETCRDFGHMQMGMASSMYTAETAFVQGVDLWTEQAPRFAAAMEIHSKFLNAGKEASVPLYMCSRSPDHPGRVTLAYAPTMEVGYNAIAVRLKMALAHTETHLKRSVRAMADPSSSLIYMYETLTHGEAFAAAATHSITSTHDSS